MILLTNKQQKSFENAKICYIWKDKFKYKYTEDNNYCKVRDYCYHTSEYRGAAQFSAPKEIPVVFHNESNYDYYLIIKELAKELEGEFTCFKEKNTLHLQFSNSKRSYKNW